MTTFESNLTRWQSITEDAKTQQHADAIAIDEAGDKKDAQSGNGFYTHPQHCKCFACRDSKR